MRASTVIGLAGLMLTLQGFTFGYVVSTERRLTRLEVIIEQRAAGRTEPKSNPAQHHPRKELVT